MSRWLSISAVAGIASLTLLIVILSLGGGVFDGPRPAHAANDIDLVALDFDPTGTPANAATTVGSIETCVQASAGDTGVDVDAVVTGNDFAGEVNIFEIHVFYNSSVMSLAGTSASSFWLGSNGGGVSDFGGSVTGEAIVAGIVTPPNLGAIAPEGVAARFTFDIDGGATPGLYPLTLDEPNSRTLSFQDGSTIIAIADVQDGFIAIGQSCPTPFDLAITAQDLTFPAVGQVGNPFDVVADVTVDNLTSGSLDATLTTELLGLSGCTAAGGNSQQTPITALTQGTPQTPQVTFSVTCSSEGAQNFIVRSTIADTLDPDSDNNTSDPAVNTACGTSCEEAVSIDIIQLYTADAIGVDADPSGNSATSLGTINDCRQVSVNDSFDVDIFVQNVGNISSVDFTVNYDGSVVNITGHDSALLLAANPGSNVQDFSDPASPGTPDTDGNYQLIGVDQTGAGSGTHESGDGVLGRVTFKAVGSGISAITLGSPGLTIMTDENGNNIQPADQFGNFTGTLVPSEIRVGDFCPGPDADSDGVPDDFDNCPDTPNTDQADFDNDGQGDVCDSDDDGDGVPDANDNCPATPLSESVDADGCSESQLAVDTDGDGQSDINEIACGSDPDDDTSLSPDNDGDGLPDCVDPDDDNDGTDDVDDAFPFDPTEDTDSDSDGVGNNADNCPSASNPGQEDLDIDGLGDACDSDDDGDGQSDLDEIACGSDPRDDASLSPDNDGDGVPDCVDGDDDNDGTLDVDDAFPFDPTEDTDTDSDGVGDNADNCPSTSNPGQEDLDIDGLGDACDPDDDGDGQSDADEDACGSDPRDDASLSLDNDGDGVPDCVDPDDDNDGTPDVDDAFPFDPTEDTDSDSDGVGDNADNCPKTSNPGQEDADSDGVGDVCDAFPDDPDETTDSDGDGVGDNGDNCPKTSNPDQKDADSDGAGDACDAFPNDPDETTDSDGDGVGDNADACPGTAEGATVDADGCSAAQADSDGDGVVDADDECANTPADTDVDAGGCSEDQRAVLEAVTGPSALPDTGAKPGSSSVNLITLILVGLALLVPASGILWAQRRRQSRI